MALSAAASTVLDRIVRAAVNGEIFSFTPRRSEAIELIAYNPLTQNLIVKFVNKPIRYDYPDVRPDIVARFVASPSKGRFFHRHIKL